MLPGQPSRPRHKPPRPQLLQPLVQHLARLAKLVVVGVSQRQHAVPPCRQHRARVRPPLHPPEKLGCVVRRVPLPRRRHHAHHQTLQRHVDFLVLLHAHQRAPRTAPTDRRVDSPRHRLCVALWSTRKRDRADAPAKGSRAEVRASARSSTALPTDRQHKMARQTRKHGGGDGGGHRLRSEEHNGAVETISQRRCHGEMDLASRKEISSLYTAGALLLSHLRENRVAATLFSRNPAEIEQLQARRHLSPSLPAGTSSKRQDVLNDGAVAAGPPGDSRPSQQCDVHVLACWALTQLQTQQNAVAVTLRLRPKHRVRWGEDVVDNEGMGKRKSNKCCIFHRRKMFGESSSESEGDSGDESDGDSPHRRAWRRRQRDKCTCDPEQERVKPPRGPWTRRAQETEPASAAAGPSQAVPSPIFATPALMHWGGRGEEASVADGDARTRDDAVADVLTCAPLTIGQF